MSMIRHIKQNKSLLIIVKVVSCIIIASLIIGGILFEVNTKQNCINPEFGNRIQHTGSMSIQFVGFLFFGGLLCYSVIIIEKLINAYQTERKNGGFCTALFFSISLVLLYNPLESARNAVSSFKRIIGQALIMDVDVSKRIFSFSFWFVLFAVSFVLFYLLVNYLFQRNFGEEGEKVKHFFKDFMVLALCCLVFRIFVFFHEGTNQEISIYHFTTDIILLISITLFSYLFFKLERHIRAFDFFRLHMATCSISVSIAIILTGKFDDVFLIVWTIITFCSIVFCRSGIRKRKTTDLVTIYSTFSALPLLTSIYIELIHVLNQHEFFIAYPYRNYIIIVFAYICIAFLYCWHKSRKGITPNVQSWKKEKTIFIFGMACLATQIPLTSYYGIDLFEGANYSVLIGDFLNHGKLPIIEHYGGHMMVSVWAGILYGILNNDFLNAFVSPYATLVYPFLITIFYLFISEAWNDDIAFFISLLFPFNELWQYFGMGMMICLGVVLFIKKETYLRAVILFVLCFFCITYRLDLGFAFIFATVFTMLIYVIKNRNWRAGRTLLISFAGGVCIVILLWVFMCSANGINPINRLKEFLMISASNPNWAYPKIGNTENMVFAWTYMLLPFTIIIGLLYITFVRSVREKAGNIKWIMLMIVGWSFFFNFSRGLVRHSLVELQTDIIVWTGFLFISLVVSLYKSNNRIFLPTLTILMLCNTLFIQDVNFTNTSVAEKIPVQIESIIESWIKKDESTGSTYWEQTKENREKAERVRLDSSTYHFSERYRTVLDELLEGEETFVDFINKSTLYSLLNRTNPTYVAQSPAMLSGEFTQEEYIKEIENIPIILMPINIADGMSYELDGIPNTYRYYKVSEYIYQNYSPLCEYLEEYAIWCKNERKEEYLKKLNTYLIKQDYSNKIADSKGITAYSLTLTQNEDGSLEMCSTAPDPQIIDLQNLIDISDYINSEAQISISYKTNLEGNMELFYTTEFGEEYNGNKVVSNRINESGTTSFTFPVTTHTRIRLDIPDDSVVRIDSLLIGHPVKLIDYGYDGPCFDHDSVQNDITYLGHFHNYELNHLPWIWAEKDIEKAVDNPVVAEADNQDGLYLFNSEKVEKKKGNYFDVVLDIEKTRTNEESDYYIPATLVLGNFDGKQLKEKCRYSFFVKEGIHHYLFRCSTDYYWYLNEINAAIIDTEDVVNKQEIRILEGD